MASAGDKYGGEFRFAQVSGLTYSIELQFYINPNGEAGPPWAIVNFGDGITDTVSSTSTVIVEGNCSEIMVRTLTTQHTYPGPGSYSLSVLKGTRIPFITNIPAGGNIPLCVPALLVIPSSGATDSSPIFVNALNSVYFNENVLTLDPQVYDPDGDSLAFDLVVPQGQNCEPISGYVFPDEVDPGTSTLTIDPHTGIVQWSDPPMPGNFDIAIRCIEWRNGTILGQVVHDMTFCVYFLTGIEEHTDRPMLSVVPTVSDGQVEVTTTHGHGTIELMDMQGRHLRHIALNSDHTVLDTRSLAPGSYLLYLISDGAVSATGRFFVAQR